MSQFVVAFSTIANERILWQDAGLNLPDITVILQSTWERGTIRV